MHEFILHKDCGKITNKTAIREVFNSLEDGKYLIKVTSIKRRTLPQNSYLHGCIIPLVLEGLRNIGWDDVRDNEDAKDVIKKLFLERRIENKNTGEVIAIIKRTRDLTTIEMNQFIEDIIKWAAEYLGIQINYPNEQIVLYGE